MQSNIEDILEKYKSEPLTVKDGEALFSSYDLFSLGMTADNFRREEAGDLVTFVIDRNINYTNICASGCKFCAFYRNKRADDAYVLPIDEILEKINEAVELGATQVLMQGGLNPELPIEYYEEMLKETKERFPSVQRHFFSPSEIKFLAEVSKNSIKETLERLKEAGLQSIPGGGAEILDDRVRSEISPNKIDWNGWREVMVTAHGLGLPTTATMVYGLGETNEERARHILRIREIQEKTGGFTAFIPWSFQPEHTTLAQGRVQEFSSTGIDYLKVVAISRILLNGAIKNIQASWVTQGARVAQIALSHGANDFGGTMIEENVVKAAGVDAQYLPPEQIVANIKDLGRPAAQRDTLYGVLKRY
jgi:cyclic dehypoxanthinyl futalosine synthase